MGKISIIGSDLAKQVFQVHAADAQGALLTVKFTSAFRLLSAAPAGAASAGALRFWPALDTPCFDLGLGAVHGSPRLDQSAIERGAAGKIVPFRADCGGDPSRARGRP